MLTCRVFPNGEFSIWEQKKNLAVEPPPEQPDYLGLTLLPNSHRVALGLANPPGERARRGAGGITRHGSRMVRNGAFLLQQKYGRRRLTFLTCTIPATTQTEQFAIALEWADIVRQFMQSVVRLLRAAGLPPSYVGCTEIQGERYSRDGGMPLHLHVVFPNKGASGGWKISCDQFRALWMRAIVNRCPELEGRDFSASVDAEVVKKSAEGYLGKYMSKGAPQLAAMAADDPGIVEFLPSAWWCCSTNVRRAIGKRIAGGVATAGRIIRDVRSGDSRVEYSREVKIVTPQGAKFTAAVVGKLSREGIKRYARVPVGTFEFDGKALDAVS